MVIRTVGSEGGELECLEWASEVLGVTRGVHQDLPKIWHLDGSNTE